MSYEIIIQALWLILPAYVANASAVIVGGGTPIDFGRTWKDGKRLLGDGKTWRGLFSGTFLGMTAGFGLVVAAKYVNESEYVFLRLSDFEGFPVMILILFSLCFGALLGDIIESYFKRRLGKERGEDWFGFDQLDFLVGALFFSLIASTLLQVVQVTADNWFFRSFSVWHILVLVLITPFFHFLANSVYRKGKQRSRSSP